MDIFTAAVQQQQRQQYQASTAAAAASSTMDDNNNNNKAVVEIEWKPYQIDPGTDPNGEEFEAYNRRRWGSSGWTLDLKRQGARDGGGAMFKDWQWWPNTSKAHQFIQYGKEQNGDDNAASGSGSNFDTDHANAVLFDALYEHGENLSSTETLLQIAAREYPAWDAGDLRNYLDGNKGLQLVKQEIQDGRRRYGISGVPFFVIEHKTTEGGSAGSHHKPYGFSGAQASSTFVEIFEELSNSS